VASFKSTLDEALEASLLAHVVDASDPSWLRQLRVTEEVLKEIGAEHIPRLMLFNKVDRIGDPGELARLAQHVLAAWPDAVLLSAKSDEDIRLLHARIVAHFRRGYVEEDVHVPYARQQVRALLFAEADVLGERYDEEGVVFRVRAHPATIEKARAAAMSATATASSEDA
jgi:GTP-binding protein HflX